MDNKSPAMPSLFLRAAVATLHGMRPQVSTAPLSTSAKRSKLNKKTNQLNKNMKKNKTEKSMVGTLRKLGIRVSVLHDMTPSVVQLKSGQTKQSKGQTFVSLVTPDGREFLGSALCVDKNYDKKKGIRYALENAFESVDLGKQLEPTWREINVSEDKLNDYYR